MKIMILCSSYYPHVKGGGEKSTQLLAEALKQKGHEVVVVATSGSYSEEIINNVKVYRIKSPNIYWSYEKAAQSYIKKIIWFALNSYNFRIKKPLLKILEKEKPDVVHTSTLEDISAYAWKVAKEAGYPVVHTLRSYTLLCPKGDMFKNGKNCQRQCTPCKILSCPPKKLSCNVDSVVGNSEFVLNKHLDRSYFPNARHNVVYNIFENCGKISQGKDKDFVFGYIGRIHNTKGIELLIDSFIDAGLPASVSLKIAGKGNERYIEKLKKKCIGRSVSFLGYVSPDEFYNRVHCVIVPSIWHEPLARVIYESFSYAVPVIGSKTGGTEEILEDQVTGLLFDPLKEIELTEKIIKLYEFYFRKPGVYKNMQKKCLEKAEQFKANAIIKKYIDIYSNVLK